MFYSDVQVWDQVSSNFCSRNNLTSTPTSCRSKKTHVGFELLTQALFFQLSQNYFRHFSWVQLHAQHHECHQEGATQKRAPCYIHYVEISRTHDSWREIWKAVRCSQEEVWLDGTLDDLICFKHTECFYPLSVPRVWAAAVSFYFTEGIW